MPGWRQLEAQVTCDKNSSQTDLFVFHSAKHSPMKPLKSDQWSSEVAGWPKNEENVQLFPSADFGIAKLFYQ